MKEEVKQIIDRFSKSSAMYLKVNVNDDEILEIEKKQSVKSTNKSKASVAPIKVEAKVEELASSDVGRFTFDNNKIIAGMNVSSKTTLGFVDSMGIKHEIKSPFVATVEEVCIEEGAIVEYGQVLFVVKEEL